MTDAVVAPPAAIGSNASQNRRLKARYRAEARFRWMGLGAVGVALAFVFTLLVSLTLQAVPALTEKQVQLSLAITPELADPAGNRDPRDIRLQGDFYGMVQEALLKRFPDAEANGHADALFSLVAPVAAVPLATRIAENPSLIGGSISLTLPLRSDLDLYLKGIGDAKETVTQGSVVATPQRGADGVWTVSVAGDVFAKELAEFRQFLATEATRLERELVTKRARLADYQRDLAAARAGLAGVQGQAEAVVLSREERVAAVENEVAALEDSISTDVSSIAEFRARAAATTGEEVLTSTTPSYFLEINGGTLKVTGLSQSTITGLAYITPNSEAPAAAGSWQLREIVTPEDNRRVKDKQIAFARALEADGMVKTGLNGTIFSRSDSNEPELAGIQGAVVGSILTLLVTLVLSVPIGVLTAIYLEEFAPKNRWTDLIEVNINNLAAVPSIVFGLLGLAVFLNFFGLPRSAPLVGGLVLTLMSLPVIIIASRAALKAVPPSIREAALGVGASKTQAVFHHVLPLAMPGIMTGSILAMAHALGETAPLLMIGMVAFVADVPSGFVDSATVLPVEIFMWASRPERAWEPRTALAIISLLAFMIVMNALAVYLRRRFERRW